METELQEKEKEKRCAVSGEKFDIIHALTLDNLRLGRGSFREREKSI